LSKPVILWKVGLTKEGSRAASSHTGALAGSRQIQQAVFKQSGAVQVSGFEAFLDALTASLDIDIYIQAARIAAQDPNVDAVAIIGAGLTVETNEQYTQGFIKVYKDFQKPFLIIKIPGFDEDLAQGFCAAGIPFFDSAERAMQTYSRIQQYYLWRRKQ
jgi:acyl-CoA synthetase (NDP forming)